MPTEQPRISIDDLLEEKFGVRLHEVEVDSVPVTVFGEDIRILKASNINNLLNIGDESDTAAVTKALVFMVHGEDRSTFKNAIARVPNLSAEQLMEVVKQFIEIGAEGKAQDSSSGSSRTSAKRAARTLSAGS